MTQPPSRPPSEPIDQPIDRSVYRVIARADWREAQRLGVVPMSSLDERDGFIHLSSERAALETANIYFKLEDEPLILEISTPDLGSSLRWEEVASRGGQRFPHLYAPHIPLNAITSVIALEITSGRFTLGIVTPVS